MVKDDFQIEFNEWYDDMLKSMKNMKERLMKQALGKGTYQKAITYLDKYERQLPGHTPDNYQQLWTQVVRLMVKEVKADIRDLALKREVDKDSIDV